jgi:hypothetical protein
MYAIAPEQGKRAIRPVYYRREGAK